MSGMFQLLPYQEVVFSLLGVAKTEELVGEQRWLAVNPAVAKTPPTPRQLHQPVLAHFF